MTDYMGLLELLKIRLLEESAKHSAPDHKTNNREYKCSVAGCNRNGYSMGFCNAHYIRNQKGKDLSLPIRGRKTDGICSVCGKSTGIAGGWGMCRIHYRSLRSKVIKKTVIEYMGGKCSMCNEKFPLACYDLHHLNASEKDYTVGTLQSNASMLRIAKEALKCELLCSNCHRIKHHGNETL